MPCDREHFSCLFAICISSLVCVNVCAPFFNQVVFLSLSFKSSWSILDYSPLSDACFANIFLPVSGLSSRSPGTILHREEVFNFNEVQLINYFFHGVCLW